MPVRLGAAPGDPVGLDLPRGITVRARVVAPEADMAGMRAYARTYAETGDEGEALLEETIEVAARTIVEWSGVLDAEGNELQPDRESVRSLFVSVPDVAAAFRLRYLEARALWSAEGNA
ncbi:MAG TPA: hypothetical protein ENJ38_00120 [Rhodospirillales bacterium]|nr:hypothetical protein [Rhodospirillales bacterium]